MRSQKVAVWRQARLALAILAAPLVAWASTLDSETGVGSGTFNQSLGYHYSPEDGDREAGYWNADFGYAFSSTSYTDSATAGSINDQSHEFSAGASFQKNFDAGGGVVFGMVPSESLTNIGGNLYFGKTWKMGDKGGDAADKSEFVPSISIKLKLAGTTYVESFSSSSRRSGSGRTSGRLTSEKIGQTASTLQGSWMPLEWSDFTLSYTRYQYDKDVATFLALLDSPLAIQAGLSGLSNTLSGFNTSLIALTWIVRPQEPWELALDLSLSTSAIDRSIGRGFRITVSRELGEKWFVGVGLDQNQSSGSTTTLGLLNLNYKI